MNGKAFAIIFLALLLFSFLPPAFAHDTTLAYTTLNVSQNPPAARVAMTIPEQNLRLLFPNATANDAAKMFPDYMRANLALKSNTGECYAPDIYTQKNATASSVKFYAVYQCAGMEYLNLTYNMFFEISETHENIFDIGVDGTNLSGRLILSKQVYGINMAVSRLVESQRARNESSAQNATGGGNASSSAPINATTENATAPAAGTAASDAGQAQFVPGERTAASFFPLGVEHIFTGYDHILFLIGVLLITTYFLQLAKMVTSFTVAHSITLIVASLGIFVLSPRLTEPLIALTIIYIAAENIYVLKKGRWKAGDMKRGSRKGSGKNEKSRKRKGAFSSLLHNYIANPSKRWRITGLLGLIHGFGFSSVLREIGLPENELLQSLLTFNLGIEAGQLAIVAVLFPLLMYSRRFRWHSKALLALSIIIGIFGAFWFVERVFF